MEDLFALGPYLAAVAAVTLGQLLMLFGPGLLLVGLHSLLARRVLNHPQITQITQIMLYKG